MKSYSNEVLNQHNEFQKKYSERAEKKTMIPVDTPYLRRHVDEVLKLCEVSAYQRVLEIGCGMGRYTLLLARKGVKIEGLDLSPFLVEKLREYAGDLKIPLYTTDILESPQELQQQFEVVLGFFMLHHVHDLEQTFAAIRKVLKPGGRVIFLEPNPYNPLYYVQILFTPGMKWAAEKRLLDMRRSIIDRSFKTAGFVQLQIKRFGFFPPFITNTSWGRPLERVLENIPFFRPFLPFQIFTAHLPISL